MHRPERRTGTRDSRHGTRASSPRRSAALLAAATAITVGAIGCTSPAGATDQWTIHRQPTTAASAPSSAEQALARLPVKGRAPKTGYTRAKFGPAWADVDRNGCDTRNDILRRDLTGEQFKPGTHGCVVITGTLADPYTGQTIAFKRGARTSDDVQIDHRVALLNAWQSGAQQLTTEQRRQLANDPLNLQAADGPTNGAKGGSDAATWLPPNRAYRCTYVAAQIAVKDRYRLSVTPAERDAIKEVLRTCPGQPLPTD